MSRGGVRAGATIEIGGLELELYRDHGRPAVVQSQFGERDESERIRRRSVPVLWDDWSGGMGLAHRLTGVANGYAWGENVCTRWPRAAFPAGRLVEVTMPAGVTEIVDSFEIGGYLYLVSKRYVVLIIKETGTAVITKDLGADFIARSCTRFATAVYVGSAGGAHIWKFDGYTWTQSPSVGRDLLATVYWVAGGVGAYRIIGTHLQTYLRHCAGDPLHEANWSAYLPIGSGNYGAHRLVTTNRHVYVSTAGGLFDLDDRGYSPNLTPTWERSHGPYNGAAAIVLNGYAYLSHSRGIDRVPLTGERRDAPEFCGPVADLPNETPVRGWVTDFANDGGWLVAALYDGIVSRIVYGRPRAEVGAAGPGPLVWHGAEATVPGRVGHLRVSQLADNVYVNGRPRLWITSQDGARARVWWQSLPQQASPLEEVLAGGPHEFAEQATLYLPIEDAGDATATKMARRLTVRADRLGGPTYVDVAASLDGGPFVRQGMVASSPSAAFVPAVGLGVPGAGQVGLRVGFSGTPTRPPILRAVKAEFGMNVGLGKVKHYRAIIDDDVLLRSGGRDRRDPAYVLARLESLQDASGVEMRDERGDRVTVKLEQGVSATEVEHPKDGRWMTVADFDVSVLLRPFILDVSRLGSTSEVLA